MDYNQLFSLAGLGVFALAGAAYAKIWAASARKKKMAMESRRQKKLEIEESGA